MRSTAAMTALALLAAAAGADAGRMDTLPSTGPQPRERDEAKRDRRRAERAARKARSYERSNRKFEMPNYDEGIGHLDPVDMEAETRHHAPDQ